MMKDGLRITEIFVSLQGETKTVGLPTVFVRLTGCPLRCQYCDTAYAFHGGQRIPLSSILEQVANYGVKHVTVTGGEPLAQPQCLQLLTQLCDAGYQVSLETSGALDIQRVDARVMTVLDIKTPGSGEVAKNLFSNLQYIKKSDQIKFVICDRADYDWAMALLTEHTLQDKCEVLFSSSYGQQSEQELADWIVADRAPVRFQLQLHKYLWEDAAGK